MTKIMIIRHAEKPDGDGGVHGVSTDGERDKHDLSVRGWQRAGALVRFFAPVEPRSGGGLIATPRSIFASAPVPGSPSVRAKHTVSPLAEALGLRVRIDHADGDETGLARAALEAPGPVLIAWHHNHIPSLVREITGDPAVAPWSWPDERFDLVWLLERSAEDGPWRFSQAAQRLLAHDRPELA
jgi:phosphohistidine phosphatase SixA